MKRSLVTILLFALIIVVLSSCVPVRNDRQLANIEAQLQTLTAALASTQQELASAKQALADQQEKTRLLQQQPLITNNRYGVTTAYTTTATIAPTIVSFTATPTVIVAGQGSTLQWNVTGADSVSINPGIGNISYSGGQTVYPSTSTTYILTATNSYGSVTAYATVTVSQPYTSPYYPNYPNYSIFELSVL